MDSDVAKGYISSENTSGFLLAEQEVAELARAAAADGVGCYCCCLKTLLPGEHVHQTRLHEARSRISALTALKSYTITSIQLSYAIMLHHPSCFSNPSQAI